MFCKKWHASQPWKVSFYAVLSHAYRTAGPAIMWWHVSHVWNWGNCPGHDDRRSCFLQHISVCCKKAARQLNALARVSKHLYTNSRRAIYNSCIMSNFNYCPLVWHFCGQVNNVKLEKIQERALRILFADYNSSHTELLGRAGTTTLLIERHRLITLTVFKSLHGHNPPCLNDMFTPKQVPYQMRDSSLLEQSRCRTTTFGLR